MAGVAMTAREVVGSTADPLVGAASARYRLTDPAVLANPYPTYRRMQAENPIYKERHFGWVLTRYEDVAAVLRGSHSAERPREDEPVPRSLHSIEDKVRELRSFQSMVMLYADPPQHTRFHALVGSAFT